VTPSLSTSRMACLSVSEFFGQSRCSGDFRRITADPTTHDETQLAARSDTAQALR
jgi:hypothetical protein